MEKCPYCGKPVTAGDTVCTSCWKSLPKPGEKIGPKPWYQRLGVMGWFVVVMLVLLVIFGSMLINQEIANARWRASHPPATATPRPDLGSNIMAFQVCKDFVSDRLKAPASAKFQNQFDSEVTEYEKGRWEVIAYVDAQNSFGANLRTHYLCHVKYQGNENWTLEELTFTEN